MGELIKKIKDVDKIAMLDQVFSYIISSDAVGEAKRFIHLFIKILKEDPDLERQNPFLYKAYSDYLIAAKYVVLFDLEEAEIIQLLQENFDFVLDNPDYDLGVKIKNKIRDIRNLEERDSFKEKVRNALLRSSARLGSQKLIINGLEQEPSIANWLKDYHIKLGIDKVDSLKINEYLVNNDNIRNLSAADKNKLKRIFSIFEDLKVSSSAFPMFEENFSVILPDGKVALASEGKIEKISEDVLKIYNSVSGYESDEKSEEVSGVSDDILISRPAAGTNVRSVDFKNVILSSSKTPSITELEESLETYPPSSLEHKAIKEEIARLRKIETKQAAAKKAAAGSAMKSSARK